jgi:polyisoprenoid-binding protein YceI
MRATLVLMAVASFMAGTHALSALAESTGERAIDPSKSTAQFSIQHIFVEHVTGTIPIVNGSIDLPASSLIPLKATAVLDASKMNTNDHDRDASLESPDYFDTTRFPTWTFTSTKITATGPSAFSMDGTLTMHGVTQPEHLDVTIRGDAAHPIYHAVGHIDRRIWGLKGTRLDPVIGAVADVTLDVSLQ